MANPNVLAAGGAMAPAQGAGNTGQGGGMVPFMIASNEYSEWFFTDAVTPTSTSQEFIHSVTPGGFLRGITFLCYTSASGASGSAGAVVNPDAPWSGVQSFSFENIDGAPILYPMPLYNYYLRNKWLQPWVQGDPQAQEAFSGTTYPQVAGASGSRGVNFVLKIAVELRDTAAVLANTDARAQYRVRYTVSPWAVASSAASWNLSQATANTGEVIPTYTFQGFIDTWAQVDATDLAGHPQQQLPDGLVLQRIARREVQTLQAPGGSNTIKHNNMGNELRGWIYVTRDASNFRCNAFGSDAYQLITKASVTIANSATGLTNGLRLRLDNRQLLYEYANKRAAEMVEFLGSYGPGNAVANIATAATGLPATDQGVYVYPRYRLRGADVGSYWLDTTTATFLQLETSTISTTAQGNDSSGAATPSGTGTVEIITDEMVPAGVVPASFEGL